MNKIVLLYIYTTSSPLLAYNIMSESVNCALPGYYAPSSGNFLLTFRDNLSVPSWGFKNPRAQFPATSRRKPKITLSECGFLYGVHVFVFSHSYSIQILIWCDENGRRSQKQHVMQIAPCGLLRPSIYSMAPEGCGCGPLFLHVSRFN